MYSTYSKETSIPYRNGGCLGTWSLTQANTRCSILQGQKIRNTQYSLHDHILEATDTSKCLGVSTYKDVSWNNYISSITDKRNRTLGFVKRNVRTIYEKIKELAYKTLVHSQVEYASSVWSFHINHKMKK